MRAIGLVVAACLAVAPGCHHDAPAVVAPDERPPLPPASGTPVGYLLDADELALRDDQRADLEAIDDELAVRLDVIDGAGRGGRPAPSQGGNGARRRGGGRRGGMAGGGRRGGMAGSGTGSGASAASRAPGGQASSAAAQGLAPDPGSGPGGDTRAAEVRAALARAFARLDAPQQAVARRVLSAHGLELAPGRPVTGGADGDGDGDGQGGGSESDGESPAGRGSAR